MEGGGWIAIADSRTVAVVSVSASPWDGSPSVVADAARGFVCVSHGSMVWHGCCQHIQVKEGGLFGFHPFNGHTSPWPSCREVEGGGWITIADSRIVAVVSVTASLWYGSPSMAADAAWGLRVCAFHGSMVWHRCCQHIQVRDGRRMVCRRFTVSLVSLFHSFQLFQLFQLFR